MKKVRRGVGRWLDIGVLNGSSLSSSFSFWVDFFRKKKVRKGKEGLILVVCWCIWITRNADVFKNKSCDISDLIWNTKILAWK